MNPAIAESLATGSVERETLLDLSRRNDPVGVLSIYVDASPGDGLRAASIDLKNRFAELERRLASDAAPERAHAVHEGIDRLESELKRLTDPEERGRGRILFAAIGDPWLVRIESQLPMPNRVVLDHGPFIHPLVELLDEGGPAGVVLASRSESRLLEWSLGELTLLRELRADTAAPPRERSGPVGSRSGNAFGTPTGEQGNARERDQTARFIERVAAAASRLARKRGWEKIMLSAGEQETDSLAEALPPALRAIALRDPRVLVGLDAAALAEIVTQRIRAAHREFEQQLIGEVREQAQGASAAALGLSEVVAALNQARVAHLIYDPFIRYRGSVGHDRSLYAEGETALAVSSAPAERITERIVERALETGARVSPVEGAATNGLADAGGIAAVLRW
jgi:hypothetical protein